jgi:hypothetical protein
MSNLQSDFYVQFTPEFLRRHSADVDPAVRALHPKLTKTRPRGSETRGCVVVKFRVLLPHEAFVPLAPSCVVEVPLENTETVTVNVLPPDTAES